MKVYLVGGAVRDEIMGQKSKDLDYTVVFDDTDLIGVKDMFEFMCERFEKLGYKIFVKTPEFFTIRAQTPDRKETADFVLAREEGPYSDGRRPDWVRAGTLEMDLARRDFSFNAIAKAADGSYIDPFNGLEDIEAGLIRTVGDPSVRMREDALRALRALRFAVTKKFSIAADLDDVLRRDVDLHDALRFKISAERKREELNKMFAADTIGGINMLHRYPSIMAATLIDSGITLEATMKRRK